MIMKLATVINEKKIDLTFIPIFEDKDENPVFFEWTKVDEFIDDLNKFIKNLKISLDEDQVELDSFSVEDKSKIISSIFEEVKLFKTKEIEFLNYHNTGIIPSDAYSNRDETYDEPYNQIDRYPILVKEFFDKTGEKIQLRKKDEKLKYVKKNKDDEILRDTNGNCLYLSDEEMIAKNLPMTSTTILAFNEKEKSVGIASDEWGADGIWIRSSYQKRGIGVVLLETFRSQFPESRKMGQMTIQGIKLVRSYFRSKNQ